MGVSGDEPEERPSCQRGCESQRIRFSIVSLHCQLTLAVTPRQAPETRRCTVGNTGEMSV